jgi:hypothetical protein
MKTEPPFSLITEAEKVSETLGFFLLPDYGDRNDLRNSRLLLIP